MRLGFFLFVMCFASLLAFAPAQAGSAPSDVVSCACEESQCPACEVETGTDFYTAKCGPGGARVKSCKRAKCQPAQNHKQCLADLGLAPKPEVAKEEKPEPPPVVAVGRIQFADGAASVVRADGKTEAARSNASIFQSDILVTEANGKIRVIFRDGNELNVTPKSRVEIAEHVFEPKDNVRRVRLNLAFGKIRAKVNQKYDTKDNTFQIRTRTAVAGVRGTDFVTSFEPGDTDWVTEVRTLSGEVDFGGIDGGKSVKLPQGTFASFTVGAPEKGKESDLNPIKLAANGTLSPVFRIPEADYNELDMITDFKSGPDEEARGERKPASEKDVAAGTICAEPRAQYNQCSWSCVGNPKGEKRCRTDLKGVSCIRRICRANGEWKDEKRLPASSSDQCPAEGFSVKPCGTYW